MGQLNGIARRERKRAPMQTLEAAGITLASGVAGDFRGRPGRRQVTVLSTESWQRACAELGQELPWTTRRANLLLEDIDLPGSTGSILQVGPVRLRISGELDPCSRMDEQCPGLTAALTPEWRGGVSCEVLDEGEVRIGDAVELHEAGS